MKFVNFKLVGKTLSCVFMCCMVLQGCALKKQATQKSSGQKPRIEWYATHNPFKHMYEEMIPKAGKHFIDALALHGIHDAKTERLVKAYDVRIYDQCSQYPCTLAGIYLGYHGLQRVELMVHPSKTPELSSYCHELLHMFEHRVLGITLSQLEEAEGHFYLGDEVAGSIIATCKSFMAEDALIFNLMR